MSNAINGWTSLRKLTIAGLLALALALPGGAFARGGGKFGGAGTTYNNDGTTNTRHRGPGDNQGGGNGNSGPSGGHHDDNHTTRTPRPTPTPRATPTPNPDRAAAFEQRWLNKTIDINGSALVLIADELASTTSTEIKDLATALQTTISLQQTQLAAFLLDIYGTTHTPKVARESHELEVDHDDNYTTDAVFLARLIGFEHRILAQAREARKLPTPDVAKFARGLVPGALDVIKLAKEWLRLLEDEAENEVHDGPGHH